MWMKSIFLHFFFNTIIRCVKNISKTTVWMDLPGILSDIMKDLVSLNEEAADSNQLDIHSLCPSPQTLFSVFFFSLLVPVHIFVVVDPQQVLRRWPRVVFILISGWHLNLLFEACSGRIGLNGEPSEFTYPLYLNVSSQFLNWKYFFFVPKINSRKLFSWTTGCLYSHQNSVNLCLGIIYTWGKLPCVAQEH